MRRGRVCTALPPVASIARRSLVADRPERSHLPARPRGGSSAPAGAPRHEGCGRRGRSCRTPEWPSRCSAGSSCCAAAGPCGSMPRAVRGRRAWRASAPGRPLGIHQRVREHARPGSLLRLAELLLPPPGGVGAGSPLVWGVSTTILALHRDLEGAAGGGLPLGPGRGAVPRRAVTSGARRRPALRGGEGRSEARLGTRMCAQPKYRDAWLCRRWRGASSAWLTDFATRFMVATLARR